VFRRNSTASSFERDLLPREQSVQSRTEVSLFLFHPGCPGPDAILQHGLQPPSRPRQAGIPFGGRRNQVDVSRRGLDAEPAGALFRLAFVSLGFSCFYQLFGNYVEFAANPFPRVIGDPAIFRPQDVGTTVSANSQTDPDFEGFRALMGNDEDDPLDANFLTPGHPTMSGFGRRFFDLSSFPFDRRAHAIAGVSFSFVGVLVRCDETHPDSRQGKH